MIWLTGFLVVLLLFIIGVLVTPMVLYVDTQERRYEFVITGFFLFRLVTGETIRPEMRIAGINVPFSPGKKRETEEESGKPAKKRQRVKKSFQAWRFLITRMIGSFRIKKFVADIDTGDVVVNSWLVPVLFFLRRPKAAMQINYEGRVYVHCEIQSRLIKLVWIFVRFLTKK